jgi:hypothetical protein
MRTLNQSICKVPSSGGKLSLYFYIKHIIFVCSQAEKMLTKMENNTGHYSQINPESSSPLEGYVSESYYFTLLMTRFRYVLYSKCTNQYQYLKRYIHRKSFSRSSVPSEPSHRHLPNRFLRTMSSNSDTQILVARTMISIPRILIQ